MAICRKTGRKLKITASDLTKKHLLVFPDDLAEFGVSPEKFCIASAVRMSVSIPVFLNGRWRDQTGEEHLIVDGGLLSNYPLWLLDDLKNHLSYPTFGFKFIEERERCISRICHARPNALDYVKSIVATSLDALDNYHLSERDYQRTIRISAVVGKRRNIAIKSVRWILISAGRTARHCLKWMEWCRAISAQMEF